MKILKLNILKLHITVLFNLLVITIISNSCIAYKTIL